MDIEEPSTVTDFEMPEENCFPLGVSVARASKLFSPYLDDGFRKDRLELVDAVLENKDVMHARLRLLDWEADSQEEFHLSAQTATRWIQQLAIVFACVDQGQTEKPGEVYLKKLSIEFRRLVKSTHDPIRVKLEITERVKRKRSFTYEMNISINDGSFVSSGVFRFPMPSTAGPAQYSNHRSRRAK